MITFILVNYVITYIIKWGVGLMRILMVNPNFHSKGPSGGHSGGSENMFGTLPPLGLLYVSGSLIKEGYEDIELIDLSKREDKFCDDVEIGEYIVGKQPDIVFTGGMASTPSLPRTLAISKAIKELDNEIKIVLGGVHSTYMYNDVMKENSCIDFIIRGEGEKSSAELVKSYDHKGDMGSVKNIVWRDSHNEIKINESSNEIVNLDEYTPAWDLIDNWDDYRAPLNDEITALVQFSRGCNHNCNFCSQWMFWEKWHCRSAESLAEEVDYLNKKHNVTFFIWADENPTKNQKELIKLLNYLKNVNDENNNNLHHMLNIRVNHITRDEKYLKLYKEAGIVAVDLGAESVLQKRLDYFNKRTTTELNKKALDLLRKHNIVSILNELSGLVSETPKSLKKTGQIIKELNPDLMQLSFATPFLWTEFGREMEDFIIEYDISKWNFRYPILKPFDMSIDELIKLTDWIKLDFYFNPKKMADIFQIEDHYRRKFLSDYLIQSLRFRSEYATGSNESLEERAQNTIV